MLIDDKIIGIGQKGETAGGNIEHIKKYINTV